MVEEAGAVLDVGAALIRGTCCWVNPRGCCSDEDVAVVVGADDRVAVEEEEGA